MKTKVRSNDMAITSSMVKELRDKTGAGMMECKKALTETDGNVEKAIDYLREKGIAKAAKRADKTASEGIIESYIHMGGSIGVLIQLNCETDFVARTDDFKNLAKDIAMHIAAANPQFIDKASVDPEFIEKERSIMRTQVLNEGKPEKIVDKILDGKIEKLYKEVCLLEQTYVKNPDQTITDLIKAAISKLGENITIGKFARFQMG